MDDACNRNYLKIPEKKAGIIKYHIFQKMQVFRSTCEKRKCPDALLQRRL